MQAHAHFFPTMAKTSIKKLSYSSLPSVSIHAPVHELVNCIEGSKDGVLLIRDLPEAPFEEILKLLQLSPNVTDRLNQAYPKTCIYKDHSKSPTNSNSRADQKRSLDLSPDRLETIGKADPEVLQANALQQSLTFYKSYQKEVGDKLIPAMAHAIGSDVVLNDIDFHYRMLDYFPSGHHSKSSHKAAASTAPRLAEHRDFGFITFIQATHPGLQIKSNTSNKWQNLPPLSKGTAIMMFGWCTHVRSNGRIPAVLHRVTQQSLESNSLEQKQQESRVAAVLFCNPTKTDTSLEPLLVHPGEVRIYRRDVTVGELNVQLAESKLEKAVFRWLEEGSNYSKEKKKKSQFRPRSWKRLFGQPQMPTSAA